MNYFISVRKNCSAGNYICTKELQIKDKESGIVLVFFPDLTLELDGYK